MRNFSSPGLPARSALGLLSSVSLLVLSNAALAEPAPLTPLDWLPSGQTQESITGISGDGSIAVGYARTSTNQIHSVSWNSATGAVTDLGLNGDSFAFAVSSDGSTIIGYQGANPANLAFAVRNGVVTILPTATVNQNVGAYGTNADGSVIVGEGNFGGEYHAMSWSGTNWSTVTDLGVLAGGGSASAYGVSGDGSVIVGSSQIAGGMGSYLTAFYWQGGTMHQLTLMNDPGYSSAAYKISGDGSTIVGFSDGPGSESAVKWTGAGYTTVTDLGKLGGTNAQAKDVNSDGSVIVGQATLTGNSTWHAFRYMEDGGMRDLNTLLTDLGVDLTGIELYDASAVSASGEYIGVNDINGGKAYVVYLALGSDPTPPVGGLTTKEDQQSAADGLAGAREGAAVQMQGFGGMLLGADDPLGSPDGVTAYGAVGSISAGVTGKIGLGNGFSLLGGLSYVRENFRHVDMEHGLMAALALRYVADETGPAHLFVEGGGWIAPDASFAFTRPYANGAGTATGTGSADGTLGYLYAKAGLGYDVTPADEAVAALELGYSRFCTDAYDETLSAENPFPARVSSGTDTLGIAKVEGKWTHAFSPDVDATLRLAGAQGFAAASDVRTTVAGVGTLGAHDPENVNWIEYGARAGYRISDGVKIDLFANGISGRRSVHTETHVGLDLKLAL